MQVIDNGDGIEEELVPRLFELFSQADRSLAHSQGGLGIGLSLVRTLVELHGGRVSMRSEGQGRGSTFEVRIPLTMRLLEKETSKASLPSLQSLRASAGCSWLRTTKTYGRLAANCCRWRDLK